MSRANKSKKTAPEAVRYGRYQKSHIKKVDEYLASRQDEELSFQSVRVKLPTIEGFADFLGVARKTLYNWRDEHTDFALALEKITNEQHRRLIDRGLEGSYNPTIAKLILSANHNMREKSDITSDEKPLPLLDYVEQAKKSKPADG